MYNIYMLYMLYIIYIYIYIYVIYIYINIYISGREFKSHSPQLSIATSKKSFSYKYHMYQSISLLT